MSSLSLQGRPDSLAEVGSDVDAMPASPSADVGPISPGGWVKDPAMPHPQPAYRQAVAAAKQDVLTHDFEDPYTDEVEDEDGVMSVGGSEFGGAAGGVAGSLGDKLGAKSKVAFTAPAFGGSNGCVQHVTRASTLPEVTHQSMPIVQYGLQLGLYACLLDPLHSS